MARAEKSLRNAKRNQQGILLPKISPILDVTVGAVALDRAMRIMDALIKALADRGFGISVGETPKAGTTAEVLGEAVSFRLVEIVQAAERASDQGRGKQTWSSFWRPEYDYVLTEKLALQINNQERTGLRQSWSDGKKQRLEDRLNSFVIGLINICVEHWSRRLEQERRHREWEEKRRREEEKAMLIAQEGDRVKALHNEVAAWVQSQHIRAYIQALKEAAIRNHGSIQPGGDVEKWITWADQQADRLDPLVKSPPSVLDEEERR